MRSFVAFRLTAQLSVASAALCLFSPFREAWPAFALLLGFALIAALGAAGSSKPAFRLLWGVLPALSLVWPGCGWVVRAALLLLTAYAALFLALGRFALENWRYRRSVLLLFALALALALISGLGSVQSVPTRCFSAVGLALALLALRALQMGAAPSARWQAGNVGMFMLPLAGGALLGTALWLASDGLKYLIYGVGSLLGGLVWVVSLFFGWFLGLFKGSKDILEETPVEYPLFGEPAVSASGSAAEPPAAPLRLPEMQIPWGSILALLAAAALILLALWLLRRGRLPAEGEARESGMIEEALVQEPRIRRSRRRQSGDHSNRWEIRLIYREYLSYLRRCNVRPNLSATTAEISDAAASVLDASDLLLRDIYRRSRYSDEPITQEDVASAKAALEGILNTKDDATA